MKKVLIALFIVVVLIIIIVAAVLYMTSGIADTADKFFREIQKGNIETAYNLYLSEEFRQNTSLEDFTAFLEQSALKNFADAEWASRSISGDEGELAGSVRTGDGGTVPLEISLVKEDGGWKIISIYKPAAGLLDDSGSGVMPPDDRLKNMASDAVYRLGLAINKSDFKDFHKSLSALFRSQTSPEALQNAFQSFIDQGIDLTVLKETGPVFNESPFFNDDGILILKGYFPAEPPVTYFETKFIFEHPRWELFGINISVR